jgi:lipocalin
MLFSHLVILSFFTLVFSKGTVKFLDLNKYEGRWFQVYGNGFDQLFEKFASCITSDYSLNVDGNVDVVNSQYEKLK